MFQATNKPHLKGHTVVADHVSLAVAELNVVVVGGDLEVLRQKLLDLFRNVAIRLGIQTAETHQQNLSTRHIFAAPQHTLIWHQGNGNVSSE